MPQKTGAQVGIIVAGDTPPIEGFKEGLRALGWVEGKDVTLELRAAYGALDRLPQHASEVVGLGVDVIAVIGAVTVRAVRQATTRIPIVFSIVVEPIGDGMATNLERPGGNVTGVTTFDPEQARTQLAFLRAVNPNLERVAILSDLGVSKCMSDSNLRAARELGLKPHLVRVKGPAPGYAEVFRTFEREQAQALIVLEEPINVSHRERDRGPGSGQPVANDICARAGRCRRSSRLRHKPTRSGSGDGALRRQDTQGCAAR